MEKLVCSVCGSWNYRDQQRSVDDRYPIARCQDHRDARRPWSPLMPEAEFAKRQKPATPAPEDLFGTLSDEEKAQLRRPVRSGPLAKW